MVAVTFSQIVKKAFSKRSEFEAPSLECRVRGSKSYPLHQHHLGSGTLLESGKTIVIPNSAVILRNRRLFRTMVELLNPRAYA